MQICNLSPITGFFESAVELGDAVSAGEPSGTVFDLAGSTHRTISTEQSGIVLVLRTFPRVCEGDSVGVILETPS